jgi:hypothetical protein
MKIRKIRANGVMYLRDEDVAEYIRELAVGETTDVRNRLEEAANIIAGVKKPEPKSCWDGFSFDADGQMADEEWDLFYWY